MIVKEKINKSLYHLLMLLFQEYFFPGCPVFFLRLQLSINRYCVLGVIMTRLSIFWSLMLELIHVTMSLQI